MEGNLVIVESPGKIGKLQKFLGKDYIVKSSIGHIRDLQDKKLSVDIEHGFTPEYVIPADKKKVVAELKKLVGEVKTVWLASDEDREGEAISWHLYEVLGLKDKDTKRIVFHEITEEAILNAVKNPREINMDLVDAQQARRVLDRLVGFEVSPILWRKIQPKLSAGRVQSVALRLVVDREREIMAFNREAYYKTDAVFTPEGGNVKVNATLGTRFRTVDEARKFLEDCAGAEFRVGSIDKKAATRCPAAPFTTSTMQQEAARKLHFPVNTTMRVAQSLYEKGLITYMRTDSTNLSKLALGASRDYIVKNFGENYSKTRQYRTTSKGAQEAHEAIRPTYIGNTSIEGTPQEQKLYNLIWKRTIASQMADASLLNTNIRIVNDRREEKFAVQATQIVFDGFLKVYMESYDDQQDEQEVILPALNVGDRMIPQSFSSSGKFTTPPPRYSEASLVKKLEELGIGRPATYGTIISTLTTGRGYIVKGDKEGEKIPVTCLSMKNGIITESMKAEPVGAEKGKLLPQEIGMIVTDYLVKNFGNIMDYDFTANVENDFDKVAKGQLRWNKLIAEFYAPFHKKVEDVLESREYGSRVSRELGKDPSDGQPIVAKFGQYGPYIQKGEGENRQFAHLAPGQLIESITLEEALRLFLLPRKVGSYNGIDIIATKGKFGPYLKYGDKNTSLPRGKDPLTVTLEECISLIDSIGNKASANTPLLEFKESDIQVINGRYGPYIKHDGKNFKIPKGTDAATLTEERCKEIISSSEPSKKGFRRRKS
ncbi:MAG: type I DNA topoisomerase [Candidatus Cryptobacteroides sp.]|nr:type I DNA topoisomerase [Bacteroidales bacterium]MDY2859610.1 type I DNA topoisomerase [Candidatus Cryptobacteroides sp.]MDD7083469.1 type I DNA topoisomerase [Bacteroidales bacterium]MDD7155379.1 type I DNA topoisomerase [Bacteroidales bacterium]MDY3226884.1 type I DNA topoisomerase [Candidatus Cryptobacteroides sp.]